MNLIDFLQAGGYRLKQATFRKIQESYFEILKAFVQHLDIPDVGNFIISGCTISGANITSGMMYIDGELCSFETAPGTIESLIKKEVTLSNLVFKNGSSKPVFRATRAIVDPAGVALSAFTRIQIVKPLIWGNIGDKPNGIVLDPNYGIPDTKTLIQRITDLEARPLANVPIGLVAIWGLPENEIPPGWVEHVPLAGRMPIGKSIDDPDFDSTEGAGAVGGNKTHTNTLAEMVKHKHKNGVADDLTDAFVYGGTSDDMPGAATTDIDTGGSTRAYQGFTSEEGEGEAYSIMNPYRVVDFIRYVGTE